MEVLYAVVAILKILGFVLLGILAIFIVLFLLILFVPVRYRAEGKGLEDLQAKVHISWMRWILQLDGMYTKADALSLSVRIFGIRFWSTEPEEEKQQKKKRPMAEAEILQKPLPKNKDMKAQKGKTASRPKEEERLQQGEEDSAAERQEGKTASRPKEEERLQQEEEDSTAERQEGKTASRPKDGQKESIADNATSEKDDASQEPVKPVVRRIKLADVEEEPFVEEGTSEPSGQRKKQGRNKESYGTEKEAAETGGEKLDTAYFIHMPWEKKKELLRVCKCFLKRAAKQILPRKAALRAVIGTPDPASTGYLLGLFGLLRGAFGEAIQIKGDFENSRLDGEFLVQGKLCLGFLAAAGIRFIFSRPVWKIIQLWRKG